VTTYRQELEAAIATLDSVASVRVIPDGRRINGIRIVSAPGVEAGTVERAVRIRAVERFGTVIEPGTLTITALDRIGS